MSQKDREQTTDLKKTAIIANNPDISEELQVNINEVKDSYDSFLYVSKPFSSTNINNLQAKAKLYGLNPAPLKGARILELGASVGQSHPTSAVLSRSNFHRLDLSGVQVQHGNEIIKSIGLTNGPY
ncbi:MAG: hypothetical protein ACLRZ2_01885 [Veillonella sp.]